MSVDASGCFRLEADVSVVQSDYVLLNMDDDQYEFLGVAGPRPTNRPNPVRDDSIHNALTGTKACRRDFDKFHSVQYQGLDATHD